MDSKLDKLPEITQEYIDFIKTHKSDDVKALLLKYHGKVSNFDMGSALLQIQCRRKVAKKLKDFIANDYFIFPTALSSEQASHQSVALYHASLIPPHSTLLDMTAGLGIDLMTMAGKCTDALGIELDPLKAEALTHNKEVMNVANLNVVNGDSVEWLKNNQRTFDVIFIDPARRDSDNKRTYNFHDCAPDIIGIQNLLRDRSKRVFIKASPLLDLTQTLRDIDQVRSIRAICADGECKEILVESAKRSEADEKANYPNEIPAGCILHEAIDLDSNGNIISIFSYNHSSDSTELSPKIIPYAEESDIAEVAFLYEPNAAMMKLSPWQELCEKYPDLKKLAPSSHLFVSPVCHYDFPGRILMIEKVVEKKDRRTLKGLPVNIAVRNYPLSAENLRKQLGVKEGNNKFIYGTRLKNPILILAEKLSKKG